ncbi:alpha/beta hydrolase fold domain-containing protein [Brevundimonas sp.]|uniref:alpha/beta hydrolase fold domain-containing protein n=1 Tax=Brevundimonas sp. TaxID=1871086 RepID=UPI0011F83AC6|nr:alpha/beta hydrolase fold domain-containing protein [Brevundimonas sp.]TAJ60151.1 MAG: alpha/beta hydrolase [Brevundimonas sp.]
MTLTVHQLQLSPAQSRAAQRVNAGMVRAPRLKLGGWRLAVGMRLNGVISAAAGRMTAAALKRRGVSVSSEVIPGPGGPLPLRLLLPTGLPRALVVDLHGGGWVFGSAALNDRLTGHLAEAGLAVASVDYRLLDEARGVWLPDAVADCAATLRWGIGEGRTRFGVDRVFVIGESAGAHLAALALQRLRDDGLGPLPAPVFVQGVFDLAGSPSVRAADARTLLFDGPNLMRDLGRLTPERDEAGRRAPDVSPLYGDLSGMPPALFITGEADPLRDDSRLMAERWSAHADTVLLEVPLAPHGFQHFVAASAAPAQAFIRRWIEQGLTGERVSVENATR